MYLPLTMARAANTPLEQTTEIDETAKTTGPAQVLLSIRKLLHNIHVQETTYNKNAKTLQILLLIHESLNDADKYRSL